MSWNLQVLLHQERGGVWDFPKDQTQRYNKEEGKSEVVQSDDRKEEKAFKLMTDLPQVYPPKYSLK